MASTITADNGVSSGSAGLKSSADSSGVLALQTTTAGGVATTAVTVDTSQNVGVGIASPIGKFHTAFNNTGNQFAYFTNNQDSNTGFSISTSTRTWWVFVGDSASNALRFYDSTAAAERMRIDSSGNLLVGTTSTTDVSAGAVTAQSIGATNTYIKVGHKTGSITGSDFVAFYYNNTQIGGCAQNGTTAVSFNTTSDHRLKTNVVALTGGLEKVMALKPSSFTWVDGRQDEGFIAHELQEVLPNVVTGEKDATNEDDSPKYQQVDYSKIVTVLTAAIQEQQAIIQTLTQRVEALEGAK